MRIDQKTLDLSLYCEITKNKIIRTFLNDKIEIQYFDFIVNNLVKSYEINFSDATRKYYHGILNEAIYGGDKETISKMIRYFPKVEFYSYGFIFSQHIRLETLELIYKLCPEVIQNNYQNILFSCIVVSNKIDVLEFIIKNVSLDNIQSCLKKMSTHYLRDRINFEACERLLKDLPTCFNQVEDMSFKTKDPRIVSLMRFYGIENKIVFN